MVGRAGFGGMPDMGTGFGLADGPERYVVVFEDGATDAGVRALGDAAGLAPADMADSTDGAVESVGADAGVLVLRKLGIALVRASGEQVARAAPGKTAVRGAWRARRFALPPLQLEEDAS